MGSQQARLRAALEVVTNVVIIAVALVVGLILVRRYLFRSGPGRPSPAVRLKVGERLTGLPSVQWGEHTLTVVLYLREGCVFCEASVPFYRRLARAVDSREHALGLVGVFPNGSATVARFVRSEGLAIATVSGVSPAASGVFATPTVMLADRNGRAVRWWVGLLTRQQERQVLSACGLGPAGQGPWRGAGVPGGRMSAGLSTKEDAK